MVSNKDTKAFVNAFSIKQPKAKKARHGSKAPQTQETSGHNTEANANGPTTNPNPVDADAIIASGVLARGLDIPPAQHASAAATIGMGAAGTTANGPATPSKKRSVDDIYDPNDMDAAAKKQRTVPYPSTPEIHGAAGLMTPFRAANPVQFVMESPNLNAEPKRRRGSKQVNANGAGRIKGNGGGSSIGVAENHKLDDGTEGSLETMHSGSDANLTEAAHYVHNARGSSKEAGAGSKEEAKKPFTGFRINRPVKAEMNYDVWREIMKRSVPRVLLNLRMVERFMWHELRDDTQLWARARRNAYGSEAPAKPAELNEREFCNLIEGFGCQQPGCNDRRPRKVYWLFMRRLCDRHIHERMRSYKSLANLAHSSQDVRRLLACLPSCSLDAWGKYGGVGTALTAHDHKGFDVKVFTKHYNELQQMQADGATDEQKNNFFSALRIETDKKMNQLYALEHFSKHVKNVRKDENKSMKDQRTDFFKQKALELDPPLASDALVKIDAFKTAIKTGRAPTEACWQALRPKLEAQRMWAERMVEDDQKGRPERLFTHPGEYRDPFPEASRAATTQPPPELVLLGEIAERVAQEPDVRGLALEDLVPIVLIRAHELYQQSQDPRRGQLYMADTEWLMNMKLTPLVETLGLGLGPGPSSSSSNSNVPSVDASALADHPRYRCPACAHKTHGAERTWTALLHHIADTHVHSSVGDFHRWRAAQRTGHAAYRALQCKPWSRNLPFLGRAQPATGRWDLDAPPRYEVAAPKAGAAAAPASAEADPFAGRAVAVTNLSGFVQDVLDALARLAPTGLDMKLQSQVAYEFGLRRALPPFDPHVADEYAPGRASPDYGGTGLDIANVSRLHERLVVAGNHTAFEGLPCGHCYDGAKGGGRNKGSRKSMELGQLIEHYDNRYEHTKALWPRMLFRFPEGRVLEEGLAGCPAARAVFEELFPKV